MGFRLMLAPMEGVTDAAFRTTCRRNGADLAFTEMARVANLAKGKPGALGKIRIPDDTPTQIQLAGAKTAEFGRFLSGFEPEGGFSGFNLNIGCSSPGFLRQGIGAAMVKRVSRVDEIVKLVDKHGFECSVKMRLGLDSYEKGKGAYLNLIREVDASFFVVHARTAAQTLADPADFSVYAGCVDTGKRIVANGDIRDREQVVSLSKAGLHGAMVGRAAVGNPGIFRELRI